MAEDVAAPSVLVIGVGSDLRRDDAAGRHVAEAVGARSLPGVEVVTCTQLVPELALPIARAAHVVFVDASLGADEVTVRTVTPAEGPTGSHHGTPEDLLGMLGALGFRSPTATLVEVPVADLALGEGLDDETANAAARATDAVVRLVAGTPPRSA